MCGVTFCCGQQTGGPVTWEVEMKPGQIFTYRPGKTNPNGSEAGLEAGTTAEEATHRTTFIVRSNDSIEARTYTRLGGEMIPVANPAFRPEPPSPAPSSNATLSGLAVSAGTLIPPFTSETIHSPSPRLRTPRRCHFSRRRPRGDHSCWRPGRAERRLQGKCWGDSCHFDH